MQDDFEHKLSQQMQDFSISPQPEIWQRVEAALPEKKRRRIAFWWWLLPLVTVAGLGLWWVGNYRNLNERKLTVEQKQNNIKPTISTDAETLITPEKDSSPLYTETPSTNSKNKSDLADKETLTNPNNSSSSIQAKPTAIAVEQNSKTIKERATNYAFPIKDITKIRRKRSLISKYGTSTINSVSNNRQLEAATNEQAKVKGGVQNADSTSRPKNEDEMALKSGDIDTKPIIKKADTSVAMPAIVPSLNDTIAKKEIATAQKDSTQKNEVAAKKKLAKSSGNKKAIWLADVALGTSWLKGTSSLDKSIVADNVYASPSTGIGSGTGSSSVHFTKPENGFNFRLGAMRRQQINKQFSLQLALHYQFLSALQFTGSSSSSYSGVDSSIVVRYSTGSAAAYRNKIHQLQLSPGIRYGINPAAHLPITIAAGPTIAYNIKSNLLLHDYGSSMYIRSRKQTAKMLYGAYLGIDMRIAKRFELGLLYQQSFSNVAKADLGSDYRWRQLQLHVSLPVSK